MNEAFRSPNRRGKFPAPRSGRPMKPYGPGVQARGSRTTPDCRRDSSCTKFNSANVLHAFTLSLQSLTDLLVRIERAHSCAGDVGRFVIASMERTTPAHASPRKLTQAHASWRWGYELWMADGGHSRRNENHCGTGTAVRRDPMRWGCDPFRLFVMLLSVLGRE